jgi:hypothetical protein
LKVKIDELKLIVMVIVVIIVVEIIEEQLRPEIN